MLVHPSPKFSRRVYGTRVPPSNPVSAVPGCGEATVARLAIPIEGGSVADHAESTETSGKANIGVVGLAVMGSNLARNLASREGNTVAVYNRSPERTDVL